MPQTPQQQIKKPVINPMESLQGTDRKPVAERLLEGFTKLPENLISTAMNYTPLDTSNKQESPKQDFEGEAEQLKAIRRRLSAIQEESQSARGYLDKRNKDRLDAIKQEKEERDKAMTQTAPQEEPTGRKARGQAGTRRRKAQLPTMENKVNKGKG